ncbi:response regulator transcription factor [Streptomyces sp. HD]|uniref:response regulator transcription factor n=1 Tax=Streptomyces sp. HD TaxID=3020892 RepID=UPI00232F4805|nr:response regulator transcription factor [Streptomyces sp. HD]MDC0773966.1 response regulator transcription factor [Streptomyces sp. HD]
MPEATPHNTGHAYPPPPASQYTSAHSAARSEHLPPQVPPPAEQSPLPGVPAQMPPGATGGYGPGPGPVEGGGSFPEPPARQPLRVVVADDNPVVRAGLTVLLSGRDDIDVVAEAADGRQAYEAAQQHRPDVVLLDVRMPGVDGISALPYLVHIAPVIMLTYSRENEIVHEALRLGAGGYLVHGEFTADQLVAAVRDIKEGRAHFTPTAAGALLAHVRREQGAGAGTGVGSVPLPDGLGTAVPDANAYGNSPAATSAQAAQLAGQTANYQQQTPAPPFGSQQSLSQLQPAVAQSSSGSTDRESFGLSSREVEIMDLIASGMNNQQIAATCFISEKTVKNHINRIFAKLHSTSRSEAVAKWLGTALGPDRGRGDTDRG